MSETTLEGHAPRRLLIRIVISLVIGSGVALLASVVAWRQSRDAEGLNWDHRRSIYFMEALQRDVDSYRNQFGTPPGSLLVLTNIPVATNDAWGRPFLYSTQGTNYIIASYGRDGKLGGEGPDSDLSNRNPNPPEAALTFRQFLYDAPTDRMLLTCAVSGLMTAFLTAFLIKARDLDPARTRTLLLKIVATIIGAVIVGAMLAAVHVPIHEH